MFEKGGRRSVGYNVDEGRIGVRDVDNNMNCRHALVHFEIIHTDVKEGR